MDQSSSLPWDVRKHLTLEEAALLGDHLICCENRHAHLVGDIPFQTLYTTPFRELIPSLLPRLQQLSALGLHENQEELLAVASALQSDLGDYTLGDLATVPHAEFSPAALELMSRAAKTGISLPKPAEDPVLLTRRIAAQRGLLAAVPAATLKSVLAREADNREIRAVIQEAQNSRLLPLAIFPSYCSISFFSGRDGKDYNSLLTVTLYNPAGQVVAEVDGDFGEFEANAGVGPFPMRVLGGVNKDEQELKYGSLKFTLSTVGDDTWLFSFDLQMGFPDGGRFWVTAPQTGIADTYTLSQDIGEFTIALSTLKCFP